MSDRILDILSYNKKINKRLIELCQPLFSSFGFSYFTYIRLMPNNKRLYLSTSQNWFEIYVEHQMQNDHQHEKEVILPSIKKKYALWNSYPTDNVFDRVKDLGINHGIYIFENNEIFSFSPPNDKPEIINLYISHMSILNHFILYFRNNAMNLICPDNIKNLLLTSNYNKEIIHVPEDDKIKQFYNKTLVKKFYLTNGAYTTALSRREVECLIYLSTGKSSGVAARLMGIGTRTVESYLVNIKEKINCFSKNQVIDTFLNGSLGNISINDLYAS